MGYYQKAIIIDYRMRGHIKVWKKRNEQTNKNEAEEDDQNRRDKRMPEKPKNVGNHSKEERAECLRPQGDQVGLDHTWWP